MTDHPITPPPELVQQWREQAPRYRDGGVGREDWLTARAAQWGADMELEACCKWLAVAWKSYAAIELRAARRPKPPSLKELALNEFDSLLGDSEAAGAAVILRALEALPDD
jgi:hypothetical protein